MKIAKTNFATVANGTLAVTNDADPLRNPLDMLDPNFSAKYGSQGGGALFNIRYAFTAPTLIDYVGIAGHTAGSGDGATINIKIDTITVFTYTYVGGIFGDFNTVLMATFPSQLATNIDIEINKVDAGNKIVVANIQIGQTLTLADPINNSEIGGYIRPWLATGITDKAILNRRSEPTVSLTRQATQRLSLTMNNLQGINHNPDFDELLKFLLLVTSRNNTTWFMQERDGTVLPQDGTSNYLCFNGELTITAGAVRELNTFKLTFNAYIGNQG